MPDQNAVGGVPSGPERDGPSRVSAPDAGGHTRASFLKRVAVAGAGTAATGSLLAACGGGGGTTAAATDASAPASVKPKIGAKYKNKTIGFAMLTAADENIHAIVNWAEQAAEDAELDWNWKVVDTMGSTGQAQQALSSFLTQKVDGMMMVGIGAATVEAQLKQLKSAGIPTIGAYTFAPPESSIQQEYTLPPDVDASLLGNYLVMDQLDLHPTGTIKVAMLDFSANVIQARRYAFKSLIEQQSRFEIVNEEFGVSVTNTEQDATAKTKAVIQANPDLNAIWCNYPPIAPAAASAVEQLGKGEDIKVYGHIATSAGVEGLRGGNGAMAATSWTDWPYVGYMFVGQTMYMMSGQTPDRQLSVLKPDPSIVFAPANVEEEVPKGTKASDWMFAGGSYRTQFISEWNKLFA